MKRIICYGLAGWLMFFHACQKEQTISIPENCIQLAQIDHWDTERFNNHFTIQFPRGYRGGWEEDKFSKTRKDDEVIIQANFCISGRCTDFGDTLASFNPSQVILKLDNGSSLTLNKAIFYCCETDTCGVYFFRDSTTCIGKYYQRNDQIFRHAAHVITSYNAFYETLQILGTIKKN